MRRKVFLPSGLRHSIQLIQQSYLKYDKQIVSYNLATCPDYIGNGKKLQNKMYRQF